jgi:acyl carrier protein
MDINAMLIEEVKKTKALFSDGITVTDDTNLVTDLNYNSIDFMQLVVNIEKRFGIVFSLDEYMESQDINRYQSVKDYVITKVE